MTAQTVLVTGATTGIGLATARQLLETEHRLILTARASSLPRFHAHGIVESERVKLRALDVTSDEDRRRVVAEADAEWGGVDVLINNAGVSYRSVVEHVRRQERWTQMGINFRAPMQLIQLVLPGMRRKRAGRIITISSVGGMMAMPTMGVYSASKWALEGAHEALWYEVRPWNIRVTLVQPGFIRSDGFQNVKYTIDSDRSEADQCEIYHNHYSCMVPFIEKMMTRAKATSESVARVVLKTMNRRKPPLRVAGTRDAWAFSMLRRVLPRNLYHWVLYRSLPKIGEWGKTPEGMAEDPGPCPMPYGPGAVRRAEEAGMPLPTPAPQTAPSREAAES